MEREGAGTEFEVWRGGARAREESREDHVDRDLQASQRIAIRQLNVLDLRYYTFKVFSDCIFEEFWIQKLNLINFHKHSKCRHYYLPNKFNLNAI